jgi:hypothetical protein
MQGWDCSENNIMPSYLQLQSFHGKQLHTCAICRMPGLALDIGLRALTTAYKWDAVKFFKK